MIYSIYKICWFKRLVNLRFASQYLYLLELKFNLDNFNKIELKKKQSKKTKQNKTKSKAENKNKCILMSIIIYQMLKEK